MVEYFEAVVIQRKNFTNRKKRLKNDKNYIYSYVAIQIPKILMNS